MANLIECPSGLSFYARKLRGSEANLFTDRKTVRKGILIDRILSSTFEELSEPGPYNIGDEGKPTWKHLLTGDRLVALIQIRIATYGPEMEFAVQCDNDGCRKRFHIELDLVEDLQIKNLSKKDREAFVGGNLIEAPMVDNDGQQRTVQFHLMTGADEVKMSSIAEREIDRQVTASLAQRIDRIEGVHANDMIRFLDTLDMDLLQDMTARLDEHDCGVETDIEVECDYCGQYMTVVLPLGGREFFLPKRKRQAQAV